MRKAGRRQLAFAFADSPQGGGQAATSGVPEGKPWLLRIANGKEASSPAGEQVEVHLSARTVQRLNNRIRELTPRMWGQSSTACLEQTNRYLRGWLAHLMTQSIVHTFGGGGMDDVPTWEEIEAWSTI